MKYLSKPSQEQQILDLLVERGSQGAYVYELQAPQPQGLGIAQYNARIWGLRKKGHNIINKEAGHFVLVDSQLPTYLKPQASKERTEPQKQEMTWETYKNERGEQVARQVPVTKQLSFT